MTTPKRNEAVAPCAWIVSNGGQCCEPWLVYERREAEAMPSACIVVPVYSQQSISALQGEVRRLRAVLAAIRNPIAAAPEHAFGVHYEGSDMPSWPIRDEMLSRIDKALNLEPPTDGR